MLVCPFLVLLHHWLLEADLDQLFEEDAVLISCPSFSSGSGSTLGYTLQCFPFDLPAVHTCVQSSSADMCICVLTLKCAGAQSTGERTHEQCLSCLLFSWPCTSAGGFPSSLWAGLAGFHPRHMDLGCPLWQGLHVVYLLSAAWYSAGALLFNLISGFGIVHFRKTLVLHAPSLMLGGIFW